MLSHQELYHYATKYTSAERSGLPTRIKVRIIESLCGTHWRKFYGTGETIYDPFAVAETFVAWAERDAKAVPQ